MPPRSAGTPPADHRGSSPYPRTPAAGHRRPSTPPGPRRPATADLPGRRPGPAGRAETLLDR
ncbi:hypothetical protein CA984_41925 [Streptosporangium minutum]|uniref:Uncharacterized protein n=1 Tax=Streptosporangium minutum TaxID=569862 RepID=A0A243QGU1_9ACTN|nr:hypothetical protein CA984_41925 [Streptosporangium minutum]